MQHGSIALLVATALFTLRSFALPAPAQPTDARHPGSNVYAYQVKKETVQINGRKVVAYLPSEAKGKGTGVPVVVFGHGQALDADAYEDTFNHLARKGVAVIHPQYDTGFFDQDWRRMAADFNQLAQAAITQYDDWINPALVIYAGHSKGGYVGLMAAGAPNKGAGPRAAVFFAPAGYDAQYLAAIDPRVLVTLVWGEADTIIKRTLVADIYARLPSQRKQLIEMHSYTSTEPKLQADHFIPTNKSTFFGGRDFVSALHYYGVWKWLMGAAQDLADGGTAESPWLYGAEAKTSGLAGLDHAVTRSW